MLALFDNEISALIVMVVGILLIAVGAFAIIEALTDDDDDGYGW